MKNVFFHFVFVKTRKLKISYGEKIKQTTNDLNIEKNRKSQKDTNKTITELKKEILHPLQTLWPNNLRK